MTRLPPLVTRVYALLLRLYPRAFRDEFGDEMQTVFADAVQEAARTGPLALARLCLREFLELPVSSALEHWARFRKGMLTMNAPTTLADRPISWGETLIGLFPFFLFGPLTVWLAFPFPYAAGSVAQWFFSSQTLLFVLCLLFGLAAGWITHWRRWSLPYLCLGILMVVPWILSQSDRWIYAVVPRPEPGSLEQLLVTVGAFALTQVTFAMLLIVGVLLARAVSTFHILYARIRQDWTRLSFGLYMLATLMLSAIDHEEDSVLTVLLILPGVILLLSALAYLRSTTRNRRIGSLVLGLALALSLSILQHWYMILYGVFLVPIIILPALFELIPRQNKPVLAE